MSWLRRLSRDRGSKGERDFKEQMPGFRPQSSYNENGHPSPLKDSQFSSTHNSQDMLSYRRPAPQDNQFSSTPPRLPNAISDGTMHTIGPNLAPAPDPLTRAFNDAIKPYLDQIDILKSELDDANGQVQQLETERADMHAWIDKRGLRPDLPSHLATTLSSTPLAASTFSSQLDRKMTMLNYDLHRLTDSLAAPLPTSTLTWTLSTLLPSTTHLASLPAGPPLAFELLIKLAGNLNSHTTGEESLVDNKSIADFYTKLDTDMVDVIRRRLEHNTNGEESPEWVIGRDVKRLEKTGTFLRSEMGLENYFVRSLEVLRYEVKRGEGMTRYSP